MSLLRLAQGRTDLAVPAIRRAVDEGQDPLARSRLMPTYVEVLLEAGDVRAARAATDELCAIAAQFDAPYLNALAAQASGAVLLAEGDPRTALRNSVRRSARGAISRRRTRWRGYGC